ncbi:hypothetical protein AX15_005053 [Amanita polypyramis BW_CC]|nr:hypothetical protein AX15_005053 [Amanita polypyramis BW_CC]
MNLRPVIAICGTTGVGKSDLAIELAVHLSRCSPSWKGARVINADSMQVYRGMDIITNKVPESERRGVDHLLMGFKEPGEQYVVGQWIQDALKAIDETHRRCEIPIVVGGTSYWIQHLIFPGHLVSESKSLPSGAERSLCSDNILQQQTDTLNRSIDALNTELLELFTNLPEHPPSASTEPEAAWHLYTLLCELDPIIGGRWHWRDTRKVLRSLQIMKESGRRASDVITEQSKNTTQGKPRYQTLFLWLYSDPLILTERLNDRVDRMIQRGLLDEIRELKNLVMPRGSNNNTEQPVCTDYTLGIYQSIGFREFNDYLISNETSDIIFQDAVERMKISTRQYAKRQVSWIRNKLLPAINAANLKMPGSVPIYPLDATESGECWNTNVKQPAMEILEDFLEERTLRDPLTVSSLASELLRVEKTADPIITLQERRMITCQVCTVRANQPVMINEGREWDAHRQTRAHRIQEKKQQQQSAQK